MRSLLMAMFLTLTAALAPPAEAQPSRSEGASATVDSQIPWFERHRSEIVSVEPLRVIERVGKSEFSVLRGATVTLRPSRGVTAEWLQYTLNEHFATMQAQGADMPACPLALAGTRASVRSTGSGFAVSIEGSSRAAGDEIFRRSQSLKPR